jgi:hypothetical protein
MTVKPTLGLGKQMLMLAGPSDHDSRPSKGIREEIYCEHDQRLLPDSLIGFASKKNYGGSTTLDCRSQNMVYLTTFDNH